MERCWCLLLLFVIAVNSEHNDFGLSKRHRYRAVHTPRLNNSSPDGVPLKGEKHFSSSAGTVSEGASGSEEDDSAVDNKDTLQLTNQRRKKSHQSAARGKGHDKGLSSDQVEHASRVARRKTKKGRTKPVKGSDDNNFATKARDQAEQTPQEFLDSRPAEVWLYALLSADYDDVSILPHFLRHYASLGIVKERMLLVVNHNPGRAGAAAGGLDELCGMLSTWGVDYNLWLGQYNVESHLRFKLEVLRRLPVQDWVVMADIDEFHEFSGGSAAAFLARVAAEGGSYVKGRLKDQVDRRGQLKAVQAEPALWDQFPLQCQLQGVVAGADVNKVVAARGFLRSDAGNHAVVMPQAARRYFAAVERGTLSPRGGFCGAPDLFALTPYANYTTWYGKSSKQDGPALWTARPADVVVSTYHFRWHRGLERSARDLLRFYRGKSGECGEGNPRFKQWQQFRRVVQEIVEAGGVDVEEPAFQCTFGKGDSGTGDEQGAALGTTERDLEDDRAGSGADVADGGADVNAAERHGGGSRKGGKGSSKQRRGGGGGAAHAGEKGGGSKGKKKDPVVDEYNPWAVDHAAQDGMEADGEQGGEDGQQEEEGGRKDGTGGGDDVEVAGAGKAGEAGPGKTRKMRQRAALEEGDDTTGKGVEVEAVAELASGEGERTGGVSDAQSGLDGENGGTDTEGDVDGRVKREHRKQRRAHKGVLKDSGEQGFAVEEEKGRAGKTRAGTTGRRRKGHSHGAAEALDKEGEMTGLAMDDARQAVQGGQRRAHKRTMRQGGKDMAGGLEGVADGGDDAQHQRVREPVDGRQPNGAADSETRHKKGRRRKRGHRADSGSGDGPGGGAGAGEERIARRGHGHNGDNAATDEGGGGGNVEQGDVHPQPQRVTMPHGHEVEDKGAAVRGTGAVRKGGKPAAQEGDNGGAREGQAKDGSHHKHRRKARHKGLLDAE